MPTPTVMRASTGSITRRLVIGECCANDIGDADHSGSGTPGASAATGQHRTLMAWLVRRTHFPSGIQDNLRGVFEVCNEHRFQRTSIRCSCISRWPYSRLRYCFCSWPGGEGASAGYSPEAKQNVR